MKEKNNIPNQNNECIPSEMLLRYLKGDLSGAERNRVERHVASCTMCSDELEGLSQLKNPDQIDEISNRLNERIDLRVEKPWDDKSVLRTYLKIAAGLVLFIGISSVVYFTVSHKPSDVVPSYAEMEKMDMVPPSPPAEMIDTNKEQMMNQVGSVDLTENRKTESKDKRSTKQEVSKSLDEESVKYVAPVVVDSISVENNMLAEEESIVNDEVVEEPKIIDSAKIVEVVTAQAAPVSVDKKTASSKEQLISVEFAKGIVSKREVNESYNTRKLVAIKLFSSTKYEDAIKVLDGLYKDYPNNDTIVYYTSLCNYQLNRFKETIRTIVPLTLNPQGVFYNQAKWYYGLSLVALERTQEAKTIFEQIIKEESQFKDYAAKELEKLKGNN